MLGILLIYFIWKHYSELAAGYGKSKWGYALLGIASYYAGTIVGGFIVGFTGTLLNPDFIDGPGTVFWNLISLPFGLITVWGLYKRLKTKWGRKSEFAGGEDALDSDLLRSDPGD